MVQLFIQCVVVASPKQSSLTALTEESFLTITKPPLGYYSAGRLLRRLFSITTCQLRSLGHTTPRNDEWR